MALKLEQPTLGRCLGLGEESPHPSPLCWLVPIFLLHSPRPCLADWSLCQGNLEQLPQPPADRGRWSASRLDAAHPTLDGAPLRLLHGWRLVRQQAGALQAAALFVGRVCCDGEGRLNEASAQLEGDIAVSKGARVRLDLSRVPALRIFTGQAGDALLPRLQ